MAITVTYVIIGGAGSAPNGTGGSNGGGAGGGGVKQAGGFVLNPGSYSIVVGGVNQASSAFGVIAGAGAPGGYNGGSGGNATDGGSGGGGSTPGGAGGNPGGGSRINSDAAGGGGGAGGTAHPTAGNGGPGITVYIWGVVAGSGSGGAFGSAYSGAAGGANAGTGAGDGVAATAATWYGCAGGPGSQHFAGAGGSYPGLVGIQYPGPPSATGGTISQANGYTAHVFTSSGTLVVTAPPVITTIDNTTTAAVNDAVIIQGTTAYTHIWGSALDASSVGNVSGTGVTAPFAAWSGDGTLIALNITAAPDAPLGARSITVTTSGGVSNAMTLTVVAPVPTLTAFNTYSGGPGILFVGIKQRMYITGTNFVAGATVNASAGLTVSNVAVTSATRIDCDIVATVAGAQSVSVTTNGGTTGAAATTAYAPVANDGIGPGMVINMITGPASNAHPGPLGMWFTVGAKDRIVTHLGRWKFSGNTGKHDLLLRDVSAGWVIAARATIDLSAGAADTWNYVQLAAPTRLKAGHQYLFLDMSTVSGGDTWAQVSPVAMDGNATNNGLAAEVSSMYSFVRGSTRTDPLSLGYRFTATAGYAISALGRWKQPGNNLSHRVVLKDSSNTIIRSGVVDFTGGKGLDNQFNYVPVDLFTLTTGAYYTVLSDEPGGDAWYDNLGAISPWGGLTINGYSYEGYPAASGVVPVFGAAPNTMYVGVDITSVLVWPNSSYAEGYVTLNLKWLDAGQPMAMLI